MIKSFVAAVALTLAFAGNAVAQEQARHHHQHYRHHIQPRPSQYLPPAASAHFPQEPSADASDIYWSPAGGNPIHYGQTTGFYGGR